VPIAIHADHYGIKSQEDVEKALVQIPQMIAAGITSIAIDASHMPDHLNLLANIEIYDKVLSQYPEIGYETEIGEIVGKDSVNKPEDAVYLIAALNAHGIFPNWIAINNGTTHGVEKSDKGIQVQLTADVHAAIEKYGLTGAQHGTSGNNNDRLNDITNKTLTTKANLATALQMISWGLEVNEFGNASTDAEGNFIKTEAGVPMELWTEMMAYAKDQGWSGGGLKNLNKPFEEKLLELPQEIKDERAKAVADFMEPMMMGVFNSGGTAQNVINAIVKNNSADIDRGIKVMENPDDWGVNISDPEAKIAFLVQKEQEMNLSAAQKTGIEE